jgi:hypothetical protein
LNAYVISVQAISHTARFYDHVYTELTVQRWLV